MKQENIFYNFAFFLHLHPSPQPYFDRHVHVENRDSKLKLMDLKVMHPDLKIFKILSSQCALNKYSEQW